MKNNIWLKTTIFILISILIISFVYSDEINPENGINNETTCNQVNTEVFLSLNRTEIINIINIIPNNLYTHNNILHVDFQMYSIERKEEKICLINKQINTIMPYRIIDYCTENYGSELCWQYLILYNQEFIFPINGIEETINPINFQLTYYANQEIDNIMQIQEDYYNENIINELIGNNTYYIPTII